MLLKFFKGIMRRATKRIPPCLTTNKVCKHLNRSPFVGIPVEEQLKVGLLLPD